MTTLRAALFGCAAFLIAAAPIAAQTNADLERRMQALEQSVDQIILLLQGSAAPTGAATAPSATDSAPAATATTAPPVTGVRWGTLYMDVHTLAATEQDWNAAARNPGKLAAGHTNLPAGSATVSASSTFNYGAFAQNGNLARLKDANAFIQLHWNGILRIEQEGKHTFVMELAKNDDYSFIGACRAVLRLNDNIVIEAQADFRFIRTAASSLVQGAEKLAPGPYDFSLFLTCARDDNSPRAFATVTASLSMAAPGDRVPQPIAASRFGVPQ
jgi:hypothetical protein